MKLNGAELIFDDPDEAATFMATYNGATARSMAQREPPCARPGHTAEIEPRDVIPQVSATASSENGGGGAPARKKAGRTLVKSSSPREAMKKLLKTLTFDVHKAGLRFLAKRGPDGADFDELRNALGIPEGQRINAFTSSITRRCPAFGLPTDAILAIEAVGSVGGHRIMKYTLGPTMIEVVNEELGDDPESVQTKENL
jgi:hypothetical protein